MTMLNDVNLEPQLFTPQVLLEMFDYHWRLGLQQRLENDLHLTQHDVQLSSSCNICKVCECHKRLCVLLCQLILYTIYTHWPDTHGFITRAVELWNRSNRLSCNYDFIFSSYFDKVFTVFIHSWIAYIPYMYGNKIKINT